MHARVCAREREAGDDLRTPTPATGAEAGRGFVYCGSGVGAK